MLDSINNAKLHTIAQLNSTGNNFEAAILCREILAQYPDHLTTLLWLAHTATDKQEIYVAINRAHRLDPHNQTVIDMLNLYTTQFKQAEPPPPPVQDKIESKPEYLPEKREYLPVGSVVRDGTNFIMTQTG